MAKSLIQHMRERNAMQQPEPIKGRTLKNNAKAYNESDSEFFSTENNRIAEGGKPRWQEVLTNKREYENKGLKKKSDSNYGKLNALSMSGKNKGKKTSPSSQRAASGELKGQTLGRAMMRDELEKKKKK